MDSNGNTFVKTTEIVDRAGCLEQKAELLKQWTGPQDGPEPLAAVAQPLTQALTQFLSPAFSQGVAVDNDLAESLRRAQEALYKGPGFLDRLFGRNDDAVNEEFARRVAAAIITHRYRVQQIREDMVLQAELFNRTIGRLTEALILAMTTGRPTLTPKEAIDLLDRP